MLFGFDFMRVKKLAQETTDDVLRWLNQKQERPFFLWVHYFDPHIPYSPPHPYNELFDSNYTGIADGRRWGKFSREAKEKIISNPDDLQHMIALYDGEVAYVDSQIGRILDAMRLMKLDQNTLVVLTSDHGESHGEHNLYFGRDLHRSCLHVPLIFNFPQQDGLRAHRVHNQVRLIDITPTILDYLGIKVDFDFNGKSLLSLIQASEDKEARPLYALFPPGQISDITMYALQDKGHKLIWNSDHWSYGVRLPSWEEFYNLQLDPQENKNIIDGVKTPILSDLQQRLTLWRKQEKQKNIAPIGKMKKILKSLGYVQ